MRTRSTYRPVNEAMRRQTVAGTRTVTTINGNGIFALGMLAGGALALLLAMFVLTIDNLYEAELREGERVCVEYTDADGYFCGPFTHTIHDDFAD